jgi:zinc transporter ZupT
LKSFAIEEVDGVSRTDFHRLCPALVQQAAQGCRYASASTTTTKPSAAEIYGYGTASVFVISAVSLPGLVIVKFRRSTVYKYLIVLMLGLAVGSLVGDSFLHLIPQALDLHDHSHESSSSHDDDGGITVEPYVWKMLCGCLSAWLFFDIQLILQWIGNIVSVRKSNRKLPKESDEHHCNDTVISHISNSDLIGNGEGTVTTFDGRRESTKSSTDVESTDVHAHSSVAWMVTVGDAIHNFADGLAIGSSYVIGWGTGLSTTIAVFCHELPHEFGDVAVLLSAGWSPLKVAIFQLVSSSTAFLGLYVGISISESSADAEKWMFVVASGMFLYVALADVIPELLEYFTIYQPIPIFITSNIGIFLGMLAMMLLVVFEEQIVIGE